MEYLRASHLGPTLLVSTLTFLLAQNLFSLIDSLVIALTIFTGQLLVGWSNDLIDYETDLLQSRSEKPLVKGNLKFESLRLALILNLPVCLALSLLGPLGVKGGSLHLFGVGCGVSYNFYFKRTLLSPLPYIFAFAALPTTLFIAAGDPLIPWMIIVGALFGAIAHFANVLKDLDRDRSIGIGGLPQRVGVAASVVTTLSLLIVTTSLIIYERSSLTKVILAISLLGVVIILKNPVRYGFHVVMALALFDVLALTL